MPFVLFALSLVASATVFGANPIAPVVSIPQSPEGAGMIGGDEAGLLVFAQHGALAYRRFDVSGAPLDPAPIAFALDGGFPLDGREPMIAWNGSEWLIVWRSGFTVRLTRVAADGRLIGTESVNVPGMPLGVAGAPGRWLLVSGDHGAPATATFLDASARVVRSLQLTEITSPRVAAAADEAGFLVLGRNAAGNRLRSEALGFSGERRGTSSIRTLNTGLFAAEPRLVVSGEGFLTLWREGPALMAMRLDSSGSPAGVPFVIFPSVGSYEAAPAAEGVVVVAIGDGIRAAHIPADAGAATTVLAQSGTHPMVAGFGSRAVVAWVGADAIEGRSVGSNLTGEPIPSSLSSYAVEHRSLRADGDESRLAAWIEETPTGWRAKGVRIVRGTPIDPAPLDFGEARDRAAVGVGAVGNHFLVMWQGPENETLYRRLSSEQYEGGPPPLELDPMNDLLVTTNGGDFIVFGLRPAAATGFYELFTQVIPVNPAAPLPPRATHWSAARPVSRFQAAMSGDRFLTVWAEANQCLILCPPEPKIFAQFLDLLGTAVTSPFLISDHPLAHSPVVAAFQEYFFVAWSQDDILGTVLESRGGAITPPPVLIRRSIGNEAPESALWQSSEILLATSRRILTLDFNLRTLMARATPSIMELTEASLTYGGDSTPDIVLLDRLPLGPHGGTPRAFVEALALNPKADIETTIRSTGSAHEIVVTNLGPGIATGVRLDVEVTGIVSFDAPNAECVIGGTRRCVLKSSLAPGASWVVAVSAEREAAIEADAAAAEWDLVIGNNRAAADLSPAPSRRRPLSRP